MISKEQLSKSTTVELSKMRHSLLGNIESCRTLGISTPLMEEAVNWIEEILQERSNTYCEMREFTGRGWEKEYTLDRFPDGSKPWIGHCGELVVAVDPDGLWAWYDDHTVLECSTHSKLLGIELGNVLLNRVQGMSYVDALDFFRIED